MKMPESVFATYHKKAFPYKYEGELFVPHLVGGIPSNEDTAKGWIQTKMHLRDDLLRKAVITTIEERGLDPSSEADMDEAARIVAEGQTLNGFKRDKQSDGGLYIEGRQLKACFKASAVIAMSVGKIPRRWGETKKGVESFVAEHIQIPEDRLYIANGRSPVLKPSGVQRRFVHTFRGAAIQHEEFVEDAKLEFTLESDYDFSDDEYAMIWCTAEYEGIGASRSQGFGRFSVTRFDRAK
jgi:hypothetical protein